MSNRITTRLATAVAGIATITLCISLSWRTTVAEEKAKAPAKPKPWITSKVTGSPEPPPKFKTVRAFPEAKFNHPLLFVRAPGTDRVFVGEQEGVLYSLANKPNATKELFFDLRKEVKTIDRTPGAAGIGELYGLVFHPEFEKNRYCYVCYTLSAKKPAKDGRFADGSRVSRFKVTDANPPRIDPASEEIVITFVGGGHNGGDLHFGPDGFLYISTGDAAGPNPPDTLNTGQDCSDLLSSVLRIDVNKKDSNANYAVPKDNPFVGMKDVRPEIWAFGFRNPWRMSFDRKTGDLWLGDVGWELWEMIHKIEKGGNYGWSAVEGRQPVKPEQKIGPTPIRAPAIELPHTIAASVTGGYVYRGKKFPELVGAYIFGDWETRRIWAARFDGDRVKEMPEIVKPTVRPSAFGEDNDGEIYICDYDSGMLFTFARNDAGAANAKFPTKLSETGLFADVKKHEMAEGVVPFTPNLPQWQDGAQAQHWVALPQGNPVTAFEKPRSLPGQVFWHNFKLQFPQNAVLVKTLTVTVPRFKTQRVETQLLHYDGEDWRGYSYAWRDDQSDADLVPAEGDEKTILVEDRFNAGQKTERTWVFHSRTQCLICHNAWSEYTLAFNLPQLNNSRTRELRHPSQLVALSERGLLRRVDANEKPLPGYDEATAAKEPALANNYGPPAAELDHAARSYLHVNCAHCHRFGGGGGQVVLELDFTKALKETGILDVPPKQGDFGIANAKLVAAGDPYRSVLYYRVSKFGRGRMPHLGSEVPHFSGNELLAKWIASLDGKEPEPRATNAKNIGDSLSTLRTAYAYSRPLGNRSAFTPDDREAILAAASKLPPSPVRDLFEGYLPSDPKGRKLGANPRPATILALKGDATKGETLFFNKEMKCANCHKVGDKGLSLGPELTKIGSNRTRPELLDSLLNPSARVEPQYAAYNIRTKDEKTYTGIIVKRDETQLILRDAENKELRIAGDNVDSVRPARMSLMPDGQMSALTPQEAADLLEYLTQRK